MMESLEILFEDKVILVINKPSGLMAERDKYKNPSVQDMVADYFNTQKLSQNTILGIVHRIDRPVSGVMLIAKKVSALRDLNKQFEEGKVDKIYFALVDVKPEKEEGTLLHYLFKDVKNKQAIIYKNSRKNAVKCELIYKYKGMINNAHLLEIHPLTGKYHQIRAQLAFIGSPIIGDVKYGSKSNYIPDAICLHAYSIEFEHPAEKKRMAISCDMPKDWKYVGEK